MKRRPGGFLQTEGPRPSISHLWAVGVGNWCGKKSFKLGLMLFTTDCNYVMAMALHVDRFEANVTP